MVKKQSQPFFLASVCIDCVWFGFQIRHIYSQFLLCLPYGFHSFSRAFLTALQHIVCVFSQHAFYVSKFDLFNPVFSFSQCVCVRVFIFIMARFHFTIKWDSHKTNSMLAHSVFVFRARMRADFSGFHWFYTIVAEEQRLEKLESAP